jgi:hypothetical protein
MMVTENTATARRVKLYQTICTTVLERLPHYSLTVEEGFVLAYRTPDWPHYCFTVLPDERLKIWVRDSVGRFCEAEHPGYLADPLQHAVWMLEDLVNGRIKR